MTHCLIIDDVASNGVVAELILEELGLTSEQAHSPYEALEKLEKTAFDVILLDWMMPEMDGIELLERIKKLPNAQKSTVIMCTAKTIPGNKQKALDTGAHAFLSKPITVESAQSCLRQVGALP